MRFDGWKLPIGTVREDTVRRNARNHKWNMADTVTAVRIAASVSLLVLPLRSVSFFAVYGLAGLTDALDGWLARKMGTASDFGEQSWTALRTCCFTGFFCSVSFRFYGRHCRGRFGVPWQLSCWCGWLPM